MSALGDLVKGVAPAIATALGGPLAGAAVSFLAGKFGTQETAEAVQQALAGFTAADLVKMKELDIEFQKFMADNGIRLQLAQLDVNKAEAASVNWFVAGWRPAVGWICAAALAYAAVLEPVARFAASVGFGYAGQFPAIDTTITMQVLFGMLGLGVYRTVEKVKGASERH